MEEDSERGEGGQAALGLHRCTNSGNCLSSKRRSFSSQGSNWGCQTVHLHGNDYFYFVARLSWRPRVCTKEQQCGCANAPEWSHRFHIKPTGLIMLFLQPVHDLTNLGGLCASIQTDQPHCTTRIWSISTFSWVCMNTLSVYLFSFDVTAVSSVIEVSCKERVYYLLQLSAMFAVLCQSSTGLPLNAIRLRLWLFAFLIIAGMLFEACDKHSTTLSHSRVARTDSSVTVRPQAHTQAMHNAHKPSLGSCLSHNMC